MNLARCLLASSLLVATAQATTYKVTKIQPGKPAAPAATGASINGAGDVGGMDVTFFAVLTRIGTTTELQLPVFFANGGGGEVLALSDRADHLVGWGWVAGTDGFYRQRPVQWTAVAKCAKNDATCKNGFKISDLGGFPSCFDTEARGLNVSGVIVGSANSSCTAAAWMLEDGVLSTLPPLPGGTQAAAFAINDDGQIVGNSEIGGTAIVHGVMWQAGVASDLGVLPGGTWAMAAAVNSSGVAVGVSTFNGGTYSTGHRHAVVFQNGTVTDLTPTLSQYSDSSARAINDTGQIVGASGVHAYLWVNGVGTDLNTVLDSTGAGVVLGTAVAINDNGLIVANGRISGDSGSASRIFLLTPH